MRGIGLDTPALAENPGNRVSGAPRQDAYAADKATLRQRVWESLDAHGVVRPPGSSGYIPSFVGADEAGRRVVELPAWRSARVIKANPDRAQLPVRVAALDSGKLLYMAVPRLESREPFYRLDPTELGPDADFDTIATGQGAAQMVPRVGLVQMEPVDVIVCGSVAVDHTGARIGKGAGYSDIEVALLVDAGLVGHDTTIVTTVHDLQVVDEPVPTSWHDFHVDVIVTPTQTIHCTPTAPPRGILWDLLGPDQLSAIPVLGQLKVDRRT